MIGISLKFTARQEGGNLIISDMYRFKKCMERFGNKSLDVIVQIHRQYGTDKQRRYYRKVIVGMISDNTGQDEDTIHEILKRKFLTRKIEIAPGVFEYKTGSTKTLNTVETNEYHKKCREWAWDFLRLSVPLPNEVDYAA